jgi:hypothetical protein
MNNMPTLDNNGEARSGVDVLLRDYFQAELPHPWPTFQAPGPMRASRPETTWSRNSTRLALAASVALLVAGYLTLSGFFPRQTAPSGVQQVQPNIASKEKPSKAHPGQPK